METEIKLQAFRRYLESEIERMTNTAKRYEKIEDEDYKKLVSIMLHDRAVFKGILDVFIREVYS